MSPDCLAAVANMRCGREQWRDAEAPPACRRRPGGLPLCGR